MEKDNSPKWYKRLIIFGFVFSLIAWIASLVTASFMLYFISTAAILLCIIGRNLAPRLFPVKEINPNR